MTDIHHAPPDGARGYPRPQLFRDTWTSLDATWDFALDREARWRLPADVVWERTVLVPFAPETRASGVTASVACGTWPTAAACRGSSSRRWRPSTQAGTSSVLASRCTVMVPHLEDAITRQVGR